MSSTTFCCTTRPRNTAWSPCRSILTLQATRARKTPRCCMRSETTSGAWRRRRRCRWRLNKDATCCCAKRRAGRSVLHAHGHLQRSSVPQRDERAARSRGIRGGGVACRGGRAARSDVGRDLPQRASAAYPSGRVETFDASRRGGFARCDRGGDDHLPGPVTLR